MQDQELAEWCRWLQEDTQSLESLRPSVVVVTNRQNSLTNTWVPSPRYSVLLGTTETLDKLWPLVADSGQGFSPNFLLAESPIDERQKELLSQWKGKSRIGILSLPWERSSELGFPQIMNPKDLDEAIQHLA